MPVHAPALPDDQCCGRGADPEVSVQNAFGLVFYTRRPAQAGGGTNSQQMFEFAGCILHSRQSYKDRAWRARVGDGGGEGGVRRREDDEDDGEGG